MTFLRLVSFEAVGIFSSFRSLVVDGSGWSRSKATAVVALGSSSPRSRAL
jgi:hypothetical protein